MDRKTIDKLLITAGILLSIMLFAAAGFAYWGQKFADNQIKSLLVQEEIFFPVKGDPALDPKTFPGLQQYAGQQVDNGVKAKAYANEYIWAHMMKASGGQTYAQVSAAAKANPTDLKLAGLKNTLFQGDMLRSSLLTAYAFSVFGLIAQWATIVFVIGGGIMFILVLLGINHFMYKTNGAKKARTLKKKK